MSAALPNNGLVSTFANPTLIADNLVVAAAGAGIRIRVVSVFVLADLPNTITFKSAAGAITAAFSVAANGGFVLPPNDDGWFTTDANEALNVALTAATAVGVQINYKLTTV